MNQNSSRSHTIFQILLESVSSERDGYIKRSKINLGDLAGSEKINKEEQLQNQHMKELKNINLSLTTLGKVISMMGR